MAWTTFPHCPRGAGSGAAAQQSTQRWQREHAAGVPAGCDGSVALDREYAPAACHGNVMIVDGLLTSVGSINFDDRTEWLASLIGIQL